ncbi:hypothetical protein EON66_12000 [archaeon]|nr:MAG: hypothetical protein EON66_12000 [archaeon]
MCACVPCRYYGLDACMSNLMRPGMYGAYHHITVPTRTRSNSLLPGASCALAPASVVGTLCENNDWFAKVRPTRNMPLAVQLLTRPRTRMRMPAGP